MPINILGMIGVAPPAGGATVHVIGGGIDRDYVRCFASCMRRQASIRYWLGTHRLRLRDFRLPNTQQHTPNI